MSSASVTRRIAQASGIVMASVLASRVLGFFRDWTVAHQIGSNATTDAFYAAFTLPDFLNYLVAGGSLSLTFIPVFTRFASEDREEEAWHVFSTVICAMGLLLAAVVVAGEIYSPQLVEILTPGFKPTAKAEAVFLTRLMMPAQLCFYLGSILSAVQYAKGQFVVPSLAPVVYNFGIILGGVLLAPKIGITGFAVGVLAGALVGNFALQVYGARRAGAHFTPNLNVLHPGFKLFIKLTIPIMLALSLVFTDDWIIRWFGSSLEAASITWLNYGKTVMRVPLGVVGQAIGVASFPYLARLYSEVKMDELNRTLNDTMKGMILLLVPISALTIVMNQPLIHFLYSHSKMSESELASTGAALAVFSLGMFAWGAQNILARGFYAARDTITPAVVGTALTFLSLPLYWFFSHHYQYLGLALASSCGIIVYTLLLFVLLNHRTRNPEAGALVWFFLKITASSVMAAGVCFELTERLHARLGWQTTGRALAVLCIVSVVGFAITGLLVKLFRVRELDVYLAKLRL
jgi:putative peptidoglycan lipid II flippase